MDSLLTIDQVAELLNVSKTTIYRKVRSGKLPGMKVGRSWYFDRQQLMDYLKTTRGIRTWQGIEEFDRRDEVLPFGPPLWKEVYAPQLRQFISSILNMEPHYFVPLTRKAARIVDSLVDIPPSFRDRILFPPALDLIPSTDLRNKVIAIFDETAQFGTTLSNIRGQVEKKGAKPLTFAFARAKSKVQEHKFKDEKAKAALDLDDAEIRQLTTAIAEYLILQERPTDVEHPVLAIRLSQPMDGSRIARLAQFLARYGRVWSVPTVAEREGVVALALDKPSFFDLSSLLPSNFFEQEGSVKIRVYTRDGSNCFYVTAMAYPKLRVDESFLAHCAARRDLRRWVTDIMKSCSWLSQEESAKLAYELTTAYFSTVMLARFLALLDAETSTLQSTIVKRSLDTESLRRYFGSHVGDSLINLIFEELNHAGFSEMRQLQLWDAIWKDIEWKVDLNNQGAREVRALMDSQPVVRLVTEWFHREQDVPSAIFLKRGLSRTEIKDQTGVPDADLSKWLDLLLDIGMLAPLYKTYPINGGWWITRAYRIGETQQGWKGLEPEWPGKAGAGAESITYNLNRDLRIIAYVLQRLMRYRKLTLGVPRVTAEKVLSNIVLDWRKLKKGPTYIELRPDRMGPMITIPAGLTHSREGSLSFLSKYATFKCDNPKKLYIPLDTAVHEVTEYLTPDEQTFLDQCANIYSRLLGGSQDTPKLLALAIGRDKEMAYRYAYADVEFWIDDFRHFMGHARRVLAGEMEPQEATPFLNNAANAAFQLISKIEALRLIEQVRMELRSMEEATEPLGRIACEIADTIQEYELGERFNALDIVGEFLRVFTSVVKFVLDRAGWPVSKGPRPRKTLKEFEDQLNRATQNIGLEPPLFRDLPVENDSMVNAEYLRQSFLPQMEVAHRRILQLLNDRLSRPGGGTRVYELPDMESVLWYSDIFREISKHNLKVGCVVNIDFRGFTSFIDRGRESWAEAEAMLNALHRFIESMVEQSPESFIKAKAHGDSYMLFCWDAALAAVAVSSVVEWNAQRYTEGHMLLLGVGFESGEYLAIDEFRPGPPVFHAVHLSEIATDGIILVGESAAEDLQNRGFEVVPAAESNLKLGYKPDELPYKVYRLSKCSGPFILPPVGPQVKSMARIFLSYAREDKEKVVNLHQRLSDAGFKPWMDEKDILPGEVWESSIQRAIRRSDFFLVCLSAHSVNKRGSLQRETKDALNIWQEKLDSDIYLIPARLEDCEVPESLRSFQPVNLFEKDGWTRLVRAIQVGMERRAEVPANEELSLGVEVTTLEGFEQTPA